MTKADTILSAVCKASHFTVEELRQGGHDHDRIAAREAACVLMLTAGLTHRDVAVALWRRKPSWAVECERRAMTSVRRGCWRIIEAIKGVK